VLTKVEKAKLVTYKKKFKHIKKKILIIVTVLVITIVFSIKVFFCSIISCCAFLTALAGCSINSAELSVEDANDIDADTFCLMILVAFDMKLFAAIEALPVSCLAFF